MKIIMVQWFCDVCGEETPIDECNTLALGLGDTDNIRHICNKCVEEHGFVKENKDESDSHFDFGRIKEWFKRVD